MANRYRDNLPFLSVITVVFNAERHIEETIKSVLSQTYKNIEYIIVDGGSTDKTLEIIRKYDNFIDHWVSKSDNGIYDAMNKGAEMANGDWMHFMNAGDSFCSNNVVKKVMDVVKDTPNALLIYGGADVYDKGGRFVKGIMPLQFTKSNLDRFATRTVCHQSIFVSKKIAPRYSLEFKLKGELDWYYNIAKFVDPDCTRKLDFIVCNYSFGGVGDQRFFQNYFERLKVMWKHNDATGFAVLLPFMIIPLIFRIKKKFSAK